MMRLHSLPDSFLSHSTRLVSCTTVVASMLFPITAITGSRAITRLLASLKASLVLLSSLLIICLSIGCTHSHVIEVTVTNASNEKVSNIAIEYPEASFGINSLDPGKSYQYRIKPTSTGPAKITFLNSQAQNRVSTGPVVHKDDEGSMDIKVTQDGATAEAKLGR